MVRKALSNEGIEADHFQNVAEARYGLGRGDYAVLVIDRGLPDGDGLNFLRELRAAGKMTPCLMLTARDALHDRVDGLESGADDYVTKPFSMSELVARVRTLLRRPPVLTDLILTFGDISVDPQQRCLRCHAEAIQLAPAELQVILCLIRAGGHVVRHAALEHAGWGLEDAVTPNALEVVVHRLRKKLISIGSTTKVSNMRGAGFSLSLHQC
jgi:DNA-binding response OmpR family regulator